MLCFVNDDNEEVVEGIVLIECIGLMGTLSTIVSILVFR